ncbi:MAG TPA: hypothetical protein VJ720_03200 [Chitinophaga sp.]|nr:hypothetical protein [Chitinophaga sp.]
MSNIVIEYLLDRGNKEKEIALNNWLEEDNENRQLFLEIKEIWETSGNLPAEQFNPFVEWKALAVRMTGRWDK